MIIGVVGLYASGKDTFADYLAKKGFTHFSLSDAIRDEVKLRNKESTRELLIKVGNELRENYGHDILAKRIVDKMVGKQGHFVVSSIRHPAEAEVLKKAGAFFVVEIRTPIEERFRRIKQRNRENDPKTLEDLKASEKKESATSGAGQQLTNVIALAEYVVSNDSTEKEKSMPTAMRPTQDQLNQLISERPDKVRYYMNIAREVSKRANCLTTKHGCIIVKADQIIATGYNGPPRKVRDCLERGTCLRRELRIPSGQRYELCRTIHSEANALINAARAGTSVMDGDMYLFSEKVWKDEREVIDAHPCFICKKFVINAGINNVYCMQKDGRIKLYKVVDWIKAWETGDMTDDMNIYDSNYKGMSERKCC
jgi:dCMP deaminase